MVRGRVTDRDAVARPAAANLSRGVGIGSARGMNIDGHVVRSAELRADSSAAARSLHRVAAPEVAANLGMHLAAACAAAATEADGGGGAATVDAVRCEVAAGVNARAAAAAAAVPWWRT